MPTDKRARQKAARQARMAELRRAQQRRRNMKRGGVVAGILVIALILALWSGGVFSSGKSKTSTKNPTSTSTASTSTTTTPASTTTATTVPISSVPSLSLSKLETYLTKRAAPQVSLSCSAPDKASSSTTTTTTPASGHAVSIVEAPAGVGFPNLNGSSPRYTKFTSAPPFCINVKDTYTATMKTTAGTIVIRLLPKYAPNTVNNFVFLAGYHYFDGTIFHRVITGFVDQGGDPTGKGTGGPGYEFASEVPKSNKAYDPGSLAMANSGSADTNGSQFFFTVGNGGQDLQASYSVYGQVISGLDIVNKINDGGTTGGTPKTYYKIETVTISVAKG